MRGLAEGSGLFPRVQRIPIKAASELGGMLCLQVCMQVLTVQKLTRQRRQVVQVLEENVLWCVRKHQLCAGSKGH